MASVTDKACGHTLRRRFRAVLTVGTIAAAALIAGAPAALASVQAPVGLGTAAPFGVLAGQSVTNTGPSVITRDLGVSPGTAITGFPPGVVTGAEHSADAVALQAQNDLTTAYLDAAGRAPDAVTSVLTGQTLAPGVYKANAGMSLTARSPWTVRAGPTRCSSSKPDPR